MTTVGLLMMILSYSFVLLLTIYCFYRVFHTPGVEKHEHSLLEIDTHDEDAPES